VCICYRNMRGRTRILELLDEILQQSQGGSDSHRKSLLWGCGGGEGGGGNAGGGGGVVCVWGGVGCGLGVGGLKWGK